MRFKRTQIRTVSEVVATRKTCDVCGAAIVSKHLYDGDDVTIEARLGDVYPEGDHRRAYEIDCCPSCFLGKVVPAISALGATFRSRGTDEDDRVEEESHVH